MANESEKSGRKLDGFEISVKETLGSLTDLRKQGTTLGNLTRLHDYLALEPLEVEGSGEVDTQVNNAKIKLGATVGAKYLVRAYNRKSDVDSDGVVAVESEQDAYLKHESAASVEGTLKGTVSKVGFGIDLEAGKAIRLLDYRKHRAIDAAAVSIINNITSARFPFRQKDVLSLKAGDALAFIVRGKLALTASVTVSDAMVVGLSALDRLLGVAGAGAIKIGAAASLSVVFGISDDYKVVFRRGTGGAVDVDIRKARGTKRGISGSLGVEVGLADPAKLAALIHAYIEGRLGHPMAKVKGLLQQVSTATSLDDLSGPQRKLAEAVAERIGFADLQGRFDAFKARVEDLEARLQQELVAALSTKLKIQMTFSYTRVQTDETVVRFEIARQLYPTHHRDLLLGKLSDVLEKLRQGTKGFQLHEYLRTLTIEENRSFGLNIAVGDWAFGGGVEEELRWRRQEAIDDNVRLAFDGRYTNEARWWRLKERYGFELSSAMDIFRAVPRGSDFKWQLKFATFWQSKHKKKSTREEFFRAILDEANVFRALPSAQNDAVRSALKEVESKSPLEAEIEVTVDDKGVRRLMAAELAALERAWIYAMAAALPPLYTLDPRLRGNLDDRLKIYGEVAGWVFEETRSSGVGFLKAPDYHRAEAGYSEIDILKLQRVDLENLTPQLESQRLFTLWELWHPRQEDVRTKNQPAARCKQCHGWLAELNELASGSAVSFEAMKDAFAGLRQRIRSERYYARLLCSAFLKLLSDAGESESFTASMKITAPDGKTIVVA